MHARQPLKIENSTIISLYLIDKVTDTFLLSEKTKQKYFAMQNFSIIKNYPKLLVFPKISGFNKIWPKKS